MPTGHFGVDGHRRGSSGVYLPRMGGGQAGPLRAPVVVVGCSLRAPTVTRRRCGEAESPGALDTRPGTPEPDPRAGTDSTSTGPRAPRNPPPGPAGTRRREPPRGSGCASAAVRGTPGRSGEQRLPHSGPVLPVFPRLQPSGRSPPRFPSVISVTGTAERKGTELSLHQF